MQQREIENILGYEFIDSNLLRQSLTHPSFVSSNHYNKDYERLEFLGDSVLNLVITEYLLQNYKEIEGDLAKRRAMLINGDTLSKVAKKLSLGKFIIMASGEEASGGRQNKKNLENIIEAIIGAIYIDGGYKNAQRFILDNWKPIAIAMKEIPLNPKTQLQEWSQSQHKGIPEYITLGCDGPPHNPNFSVLVRVGNIESDVAYGKSKKEAEINAALSLLQKMEIKSYYEK